MNYFIYPDIDTTLYQASGSQNTGLDEVLEIRNYDSANGIPNFAAICLNQIPGDPESTKGNKSRMAAPNNKKEN